MSYDPQYKTSYKEACITSPFIVPSSCFKGDKTINYSFVMLPETRKYPLYPGDFVVLENP